MLYRSQVRQRLELPVLNLDQLNSTLHLLEEIRDMENKIDDIYLPIETMYANLRWGKFGPKQKNFPSRKLIWNACKLSTILSQPLSMLNWPLLSCVCREFELRLPRSEVEEVDHLRDRWQELLQLADEVRHVLLKERRGAFEQELDKQVKVGTGRRLLP